MKRQLIEGQTKVMVYIKGVFEYEGTYMGLGTIGLGLNGVKQGALIAHFSDDDPNDEGSMDGTTTNYAISVVCFKNLVFLGGE